MNQSVAIWGHYLKPEDVKSPIFFKTSTKNQTFEREKEGRRKGENGREKAVDGPRSLG